MVYGNERKNHHWELTSGYPDRASRQNGPRDLQGIGIDAA